MRPSNIKHFFKGMVVQAKFADSHIADKNTIEKEDEEKVSIQGTENKSFEKNENDQKPNEENQGISDKENLSTTEMAESQEL